MTEKGEGAPTETSGKPHEQGEELTYRERFDAALASWRKAGCPIAVDGKPCGAPPHRAKISPPDENGRVKFLVDCTSGHKEVFEFIALETEVLADAERARLAHEEAKAKAATGGEDAPRDPMIATFTVTMDMRTQNVNVADSYVPNPGVGAMMALIAQKWYLDQLSMKPTTGPGLVLPKPKKLIDPSGRQLS